MGNSKMRLHSYARGAMVCLLALAVAFLGARSSSARQQNTQKPPRPPSSPGDKTNAAGKSDHVPDLSGFWERRDESATDNFGKFGEKVPAAQVTPEVKKFNEE